MQCPQCQHENAPDAKFCNQCGTALAPKCPSCGHENASEAKFCNQFGTPLKPASQSATVADKPNQPDPPTPDAERRQLTVMFCDLADSTRLSGQLDPEDLRDVIRAYQSTSAEVIEHYDGYIAQHLGDGLMVYFGWPQAHEDDAQRAVHAGLGIIEAMGQLNTRLEQEKGIRLAVRIGIHTGLVVVGEIGQGPSQEHLALGETPNVASRLEGMAEPDTVAISDATSQLVQGYFVCEDLGQHKLRGVDDAHQVYRVVRESDIQSRFDIAATRGLTPLVGRESETAVLVQRWEQVKEGQGQVIFLSGEAGIGKSRLLQVLRDHAIGEPHIRLECRSSPYYQNTALYPITDMFQRVFNWQQNDTPVAKLDKLEQTLRQYDLELEETVPLLATLLSLPIPEDRYPLLNLSPQRQRQKTLETIVATVLRQSEQHPLLFIVEDLHWTDPTTLELLDQLIDQTPTAAICVLLTCRPTFQPTWSSRSYLTPIVLNRLSGSQIESMAEQVAGGKKLPEEVLQQITEKTDGVPLYVEEMTKAVLESGHLKEDDEHYELTGSLSSLAIPPTLQDSLMARLDRLVSAKGVAQLGAVIGRQFSYELLQAVSQLDESTLQRELMRLVEAELVYQRDLPPQATYLFKHALVVDAAYQSLLKSTRRQYHQGIAQVLKERFPEIREMQPELLAHHYTEAGQDEDAIRYWQQAGDRAMGRSAYREGIAYLTKVLTLLEALPDTLSHRHTELDIQLTLCSAFHVTKGRSAPEVEHASLRARELCKQIGDTSKQIQVLLRLRRFYMNSGELQRALEHAEEIHRLAQQTQVPLDQFESDFGLGMVLMLMGALRDGQTYLAKSAVLADRLGLRGPDFRRGTGADIGLACRSNDAYARWLLGYADQARERARETVLLAQERDHPFTLASNLLIVARVYVWCREASAVQELTARLIGLSRKHGFTGEQDGLIQNGWALVMQGEEARGLMQMQRGLEGGGLDRYNRPWYLVLFAEACGTTGKIEAGMRALAQARELVEQSEARWCEAELYRLHGELLLAQSLDNQSKAESSFQQALSVARSQQAKSWELRAATSLARLWQSQGKRQHAYDLLAPVYGWFTEGFDTADLREARGLLEELR